MSPQANPVPDISKVVKKWSAKRGALIMALHEIQNLFGYVPRAVTLQLAREMRVPVARIYEVLTFYNYFKLEPPGKHTVSVCLGTACYLKGGKELFASCCEHLGIGDDETTPDKEFYLQSVRCVGACGLAPVAIIDGRTCGKMGVAAVPEALAKCREEVR